MTLFDPSASTRAVAVEQQRKRVTMLDELLNRNVPPFKKLGIQLSFVNEVTKSLMKYTREPVPERPDELPIDNETLRDLIRKVGRSNRLSPQDKELGDLFGLWRNAVFRTEGKNTARIETLMHAARIFERVSGEFPAHKQDLQIVTDFVSAEWGVTMPPIPSAVDARVTCARIAYERSFPMTLRDIEYFEASKRGGEPKSIGEARRHYTELDDEEDEDA